MQNRDDGIKNKWLDRLLECLRSKTGANVLGKRKIAKCCSSTGRINKKSLEYVQSELFN